MASLEKKERKLRKEPFVSVLRRHGATNDGEKLVGLDSGQGSTAGGELGRATGEDLETVGVGSGQSGYVTGGPHELPRRCRELERQGLDRDEALRRAHHEVTDEGRAL